MCSGFAAPRPRTQRGTRQRSMAFQVPCYMVGVVFFLSKGQQTATLGVALRPPSSTGACNRMRGRVRNFGTGNPAKQSTFLRLFHISEPLVLVGRFRGRAKRPKGLASLALSFSAPSNASAISAFGSRNPSASISRAWRAR